MAEMSEALVRQIADLVESQIRGRVTKADAPVKSAACGLAHGVSAAGPTAPPAKAQTATSSNDPLVKAGASRVGLATERPGPQAAACRDLNTFIDHTLLKQAATEDEIRALCNQAREHRFASVCVNPSWVSLCVELLRGSGVMVCTVVGFPLGATTTGAKVYETREAVAAGADEIDMVLHIGRLKEGDFRYVCDDIRAVVAAAQGKTVKVIIETSLINNDEKVAACILSKAAGAHFVKTSTGFAGGGATADDVALMRKVVGEDLGVKASGGIRSCDDAEKLVAAGADRLGASASVAIVSGGKGTSTY